MSNKQCLLAVLRGFEGSDPKFMGTIETGGRQLYWHIEKLYQSYGFEGIVDKIKNLQKK